MQYLTIQSDSQRITEHSPNSNSTQIFKLKSRRIIKVEAQFEQHSDNRWIVIVDRTLNRNSDRVITLIAAAFRGVCVWVVEEV